MPHLILIRKAGRIFSPQNVEIKCFITGVTLRYTLDGTDPTITSTQYSSPVNIGVGTTIKAIAFKDKMKPSDIASSTYTFSVGALFIVPLTGTFTAPQTVEITGLTAGTVIHYTTDGTEPTVDSPTYTGPFVVDGNVNLKAKGFIEGWASSTTKSVTYTFNVAPPTLSNTGGTSSAPVTLTMNTTTAGASIHYTTDGSEPTVSSSLYSEPLDIDVSTLIKAKAFKTNWNSSSTVSANFVLKAVTPAFNPPQGTYSGPQTVSITTTTAGAQIYYTTDSTNPTTSSELYTGPLNLSLNTNIRAKAFKTGWTESNLANAEYYFSVATPVFDPLGGYYFGAQVISISCATAGATIRYTTNNTEPVPTSAIYENPINIANTTTLRAKAFKDNMATSTTATAYYQITDQVATPVLSLAEGIYFEPQELTITCATDGAAIRYTTDGTDPVNTSTQYGFPLQISGYTDFRAKAFKTGWVDSQIAQAIYQFDTVNQIVAWGSDTYNQTNVPFGTDFIQVDAGMYHIIALRTDGSLAAWGRNNNQQCNFPPGNDYVAVSAGDNHSLALRANGSIVAWGLNDSLQCTVPDIPGNVYVAISAGG